MQDENIALAPGPLDDLNAVDTSLPILQSGHYDLKCKKVEIKTGTKKDPNCRMLKLELTTVAPATGTAGESLEPGQPTVFAQILLDPTGKVTADRLVKGPTSIAAAVQACQPPIQGASLATIDRWHKQFEGRILRCTGKAIGETTNSETGETYSPKFEITAFRKQ